MVSASANASWVKYGLGSIFIGISLIASFIFFPFETVAAEPETSTFCNLYLPFGIPIPEVRVAIFFCSPRRAYSRSLDYRHTFDVTALNYVAKQLIAEGRIDDRLVILTYHDTQKKDESNTIYWVKNDDCPATFAVVSDAFASKSMPPCYYIDARYTGGVLSYDSLFFLLLTTERAERAYDEAEQEDTHLSWGTSREGFSSREDYTPEIEKFGGMQQTGFPVWSPDGKYLLQIRWQAYLGEYSGETETMSYEIVDGETGQVTKPPQENIPFLAVWSPNSRYLASGRQDVVTIYDVVTDQVKSIDLKVFLGDKVAAHDETDLSFQPFDGQLFITLDTAHFSDYQTYVWDPLTDQAAWYKDYGPGPEISMEQRWVKKEEEFRLRQQKTFSAHLNKIAYTTTTDAGMMTVKIAEKLPPSPPKATEARQVEAGATSVKPPEVTVASTPENLNDPAVAAAPASTRWEQQGYLLWWLAFTMAVESVILLVLLVWYLRKGKRMSG